MASPLSPSTSAFVVVADCSKHSSYFRDTEKGTAPGVLKWPVSCWPSDDRWPGPGFIPLIERAWHHKARPRVHRVYIYFLADWLALLVFILEKLHKPQISHPNPPFHCFSSEERQLLFWEDLQHMIQRWSDLTLLFLSFLALVELMLTILCLTCSTLRCLLKSLSLINKLIFNILIKHH